MAKEIRINDNEYAQILQQAVSEIQTARTTVARQVNTTVNSVLLNDIERYAITAGITRVTSEVSLTARLFFEKKDI